MFVNQSTSVPCPGQSVNLEAFGANSYSWSTGQNTSSIFVNPMSDSSYVVTGFTSAGCKKSDTIIVSVYPTINMSISLSGSTLCSGQSDTIIVSGANAYYWNEGTNNDTLIVSPTTNTTYTVIGLDINGCSKTETVNVFVHPLMNLSIVTSETMLCSGQSVNLVASGADTYSWNIGSSNDSILVSPIVSTTYTVIGTDINGCVDSVEFTQNVSQCVGIETLNSGTTSLSVYPIPANDNVNIEISNMNNNSEMIMNIYSIDGKVVVTQKINFENNKTSVNTSSIESGIYLVEIISEQEKLTKRIVITH